MKKKTRLLHLLLAAGLLLTACSPAVPAETTSATEQTQEATEETKEIFQKADPAADDTLNILMIGNSFCYYFPDELYGIAEAAGMKIRVCNVYYSGCKLLNHWGWWKLGEAHYEFFTFDENGRKKETEKDLNYCLAQYNWDVISLQEASSWAINTTVEQHLADTKLYRTDLFGYLKEQFPQSKLYWHQTWAYQIGYDRNNFKMETVAQQKEYGQKQYEFAVATCQEFGLGRINTGEAWEIAREHPDVGDVLCARIGKGTNNEGDYYHDGDIGGGQYLNACVWFEILTGKSCVGNTFRPDYELSEAKIAALQACAHEAVENLNNSDVK